jgi:hypothetical protein
MKHQLYRNGVKFVHEPNMVDFLYKFEVYDRWGDAVLINLAQMKDVVKYAEKAQEELFRKKALEEYDIEDWTVEENVSDFVRARDLYLQGKQRLPDTPARQELRGEGGE